MLSDEEAEAYRLRILDGEFFTPVSEDIVDDIFLDKMADTFISLHKKGYTDLAEVRVHGMRKTLAQYNIEQRERAVRCIKCLRNLTWNPSAICEACTGRGKHHG
jgi:hypothetical protein